MVKKGFIFTVCFIFFFVQVAVCAVNRVPRDGNTTTFKYKGESYVLHMKPLEGKKEYVVEYYSEKTKQRGMFYIYTDGKKPRVVTCKGNPIKYKMYESKSMQYVPGTVINTGHEIKFALGAAIAIGIAIGFLAWCLTEGCKK